MSGVRWPLIWPQYHWTWGFSAGDVASLFPPIIWSPGGIVSTRPLGSPK